MKTILSIVIALLVSACSGGSGINAACVAQRNQVRFQQQHVVAQNYSFQQYATPVYASNIVWSVGSDLRADASRKEQAKEISKLVLQELRKEFRAGKLNGGGQTQEQAQAYGLSVLQQNCMKCHNPKSKAVIENRGPKLFDVEGNLTVSQQEVGSILTVIRKGIMPPKPADLLSDDDYLAVKLYLDSGKPPVAAPNQQNQPQPPQPEQPGPSE